MSVTPNVIKILCLLCMFLLLFVCTACVSVPEAVQDSIVPTASTESTADSSFDTYSTSTAPSESVTESKQPTVQTSIYNSSLLPACTNEVLADNASIPIVISLATGDGSVVAYRGTWDISKGSFSEPVPCFSYGQDVIFLLDYWDGGSLFWAEGANSATVLGDYLLERTPVEVSAAGGGRCRYQYNNGNLCLIQETGELLDLPLAEAPDGQEFGIQGRMYEPLYAHYDGEKILLLYHTFTGNQLDILYTWYEPTDSEAVTWKLLSFQTDYAAVSGTNCQACYCDGLLYIPNYNDLYVVDLENEEVCRVADIDRYVALVSEPAVNPWWDCVKIKGCYGDIVIASLTLRAVDGSSQYHELAIRQGRIIGSYSRTLTPNNTQTLCLLDENGETLYSDNTLAAQNPIPAFPRVD